MTPKVASIGLQLYKDAKLTLFTASGTISSRRIIAPTKGLISNNIITKKPQIGNNKCLKKDIFIANFQFAFFNFT